MTEVPRNKCLVINFKSVNNFLAKTGLKNETRMQEIVQYNVDIKDNALFVSYLLQ
jgi:hypothetical protein